MSGTKLQWKKRAKKRETPVSTIWRWESVDGNHAVERHKYNQRKTYKDTWFALYKDHAPLGEQGVTSYSAVWQVITGRCRTRQGAERACQLHFNTVKDKHEQRRRQGKRAVG
jgi:hypothetical protein